MEWGRDVSVMPLVPKMENTRGVTYQDLMAMLRHCNIQGADTLKRMMADRGREGAVFSRMEPKHKQIVVKMLKDGQ